jgi:hypothetical protein
MGSLANGGRVPRSSGLFPKTDGAAAEFAIVY